MIQRLLDLVLSGLALLVLSPVLVPIVIALRLSGEGEVFFIQPRVGRGGRTFGLYKFATMLKNSPNMGTGTITLRNDPRVLPIGRFLRKTKINELPQLLNILRGDMSIVGPRPQTQRCFAAFSPAAQAAILQVRPGLSGIGSIIFRGEEELLHGHADPVRFYDEVIAPYKGALEEWYVANQGLRTYVLGILLTIWVVLVPRSLLTWSAFKTLPPPPAELAAALNRGSRGPDGDNGVLQARG
jgi:lipopolysaccharide/colanic/teichoic acid biosynthesis glycosyltransferase